MPRRRKEVELLAAEISELERRMLALNERIGMHLHQHRRMFEILLQTLEVGDIEGAKVLLRGEVDRLTERAQ